MIIQPVIPSGGLPGWRFLERTYDRQFDAFAKDPVIERDTRYFLENIGKISSAEELVADRRLLSVALGAFGLQDDINNRYFIQKILSDGTSADDALANRLTDERYKRLSEAFGFGPQAVPRVLLETAMQDITDQYKAQSFEIAVGEQSNDMRLALNLNRELGTLAARDMSEDAKWFTVMGNPPLRSVFETALGLPSSIGQLDIDRQLEMFRERSEAQLGSSSFSQFVTDDDAIDNLTTRFLARAQLNQTTISYSPAATALTLLQIANP